MGWVSLKYLKKIRWVGLKLDKTEKGHSTDFYMDDSWVRYIIFHQILLTLTSNKASNVESFLLLNIVNKSDVLINLHLDDLISVKTFLLFKLESI